MRDHRTLACAAALLIAFSICSFAQPCSQATVRGAWGFQGRGTAMMTIPGSSSPLPVPFVSLGTVEVDHQGRYTGHGTISAGGQIQDAEFSGSIQVNPDCTGTETGTIGQFEGGGPLLVLGNGSELRELPTKHPLGPVSSMAYFRRISWGERQCTGNMIRGVYGETAEGTAMVSIPGQAQRVPMPFSAAFTQTYQPNGSGTAVGVASLGGTIFDVQFPKMSWVVNSDCTATLTWSNVVGGQQYVGTNKYVVLSNGDELIGMEIADSLSLPIILSNAKRISMTP